VRAQQGGGILGGLPCCGAADPQRRGSPGVDLTHSPRGASRSVAAPSTSPGAPGAPAIAGHCCGRMPHCRLVGGARESRDSKPTEGRFESGDRRRISSALKLTKLGGGQRQRADRPGWRQTGRFASARALARIGACAHLSSSTRLAPAAGCGRGRLLAGRPGCGPMRRHMVHMKVERSCCQGFVHRLMSASTRRAPGAAVAYRAQGRKQNRPGATGRQGRRSGGFTVFAAGVRSGDRHHPQGRCAVTLTAPPPGRPAWALLPEQKGVPARAAPGGGGISGELGRTGAELPARSAPGPGRIQLTRAS